MNLSQIVKRIRELSPPLPWDRSAMNINSSSGQEVVVMLHGLWRSKRSMQPMAKYLSDHGYSTLNVTYASFRHDLDELVSRVIKEIRPYVAQGKTIHFVTHSLGGVVVKRLLELMESNHIDQIGRVVMLAPPHKGSEIVDWIMSSPLRVFKGVLGPAGEILTTDQMTRHSEDFPLGAEAAVIMGERSAIPFFRKLLGTANDGIISVDKGRLSRIKEFEVVDADHTFISSDQRVMKLTVQFLKNGTME